MSNGDTGAAAVNAETTSATSHASWHSNESETDYADNPAIATADDASTTSPKSDWKITDEALSPLIEKWTDEKPVVVVIDEDTGYPKSSKKLIDDAQVAMLNHAILRKWPVLFVEFCRGFDGSKMRAAPEEVKEASRQKQGRTTRELPGSDRCSYLFKPDASPFSHGLAIGRVGDTTPPELGSSDPSAFELWLESCEKKMTFEQWLEDNLGTGKHKHVILLGTSTGACVLETAVGGFVTVNGKMATDGGLIGRGYHVWTCPGLVHDNGTVQQAREVVSDWTLKYVHDKGSVWKAEDKDKEAKSEFLHFYNRFT